MPEDKISFSEAARLTGLHINTLRNHNRAGKLKTASKVVSETGQMWVVELSEIEALASQIRARKMANTGGDISSPSVVLDAPQASTSPVFEQSLVLLKESVVRPLTELIERQSARLEEQAQEIGRLKERVRQLEERERVTQPEQSPKDS
jgi:DNA-binding transcriptional MerR regulator